MILDPIKRFLKDESGASAVEYGLIIGLIAVIIIGVLGTIGGGLGNLFQSIADGITGASSGNGGGSSGGGGT